MERLEAKNGYCECPELGTLFTRRLRAAQLNAKCRFFKDNVDLDNPTEEDGQFLQDYRAAVKRLHVVVREYYVSLRKHVENGEVSLKRHNGQTPPRTISVNELDSLLERGDKPLVSYHCSACDQQIDVKETDQLFS